MIKQDTVFKKEDLYPDTSRLVPIISALIVGSLLLLTAGFAQPNYIHNVAHDARHSFAFPCH